MTAPKVLLLVLLFVFVSSYEKLDSHKSLIEYYEDYSHYPLFHVYHNRHFSKSIQFEDFLEVLEEVEYRNKDWAKFVLTDCEKVPADDKENQVCDGMRRDKDNRNIFGFYPSTEFVNYGGKLMQNPPLKKAFNHPSDRYTVTEIQNFIDGMMPNFFKQLVNYEQFEEFKNPKYAPKLIFLTREEEVPSSIIKIGVKYFLRFDLGWVSDLTESIVRELEITKFPVLLVYKYNFETGIYQKFAYPSIDFSISEYENMKEFLAKYALSSPRNDYLFHQIKMPTRENINIVESKGELDENLDRASGWSIISAFHTESSELTVYRQKYGKFFDYFLYLNPDAQTEVISLYNPETKQMHRLTKQSGFHFNKLELEQFISNATFWLSKNFVIIGAKQKYSQLCTIASLTFFRGLTQCLVIRQQDEEKLQKSTGIPFDVGFVVAAQKDKDGKIKNSGQPFKNFDFAEIYSIIQYQTKLNAKRMIDDFIQRPIKPINKVQKISQMCFFPTKKCALIFTDSRKKDKTAKQYIEEIAINFINEYEFFEIDLSCNLEFLQEIEGLKRNSGGLVVYHPKTSSYVYLKAKISKTILQKFLKINLSETRKLPRNTFLNDKIQVNACQSKDEQKITQL